MGCHQEVFRRTETSGMVEQEMRGTGYSRKIRKLCRCSQGDTSYKKTCMPDLWKGAQHIL